MAKEHQPNVDSVVKWRAKYNQFNVRHWADTRTRLHSGLDTENACIQTVLILPFASWLFFVSTSRVWCGPQN